MTMRASHKSQIVSVSRRTDIPAYFADWFRSRVEKGFVAYRNPISSKPVVVSLLPEDVIAFVFWTRNPRPLFRHLDYIDRAFGRRHYAHVTLNGAPEELEPRNPKVDVAIDSMASLAKRYGDEYVQWRFDPIVVSSVSSVGYVLARFEYIATRLKGITHRCYFSFVDLYEKTKRNFSELERAKGIWVDESFSSSASDLTGQTEMVSEMHKIAAPLGIELYSCAEERIERLPGVHKARCVDEDLIGRVTGGRTLAKDSQRMRQGCGCIKSVDIGYYDSCPHGCIYCYANMNPETALQNARRYLKSGFPLDDVSVGEQAPVGAGGKSRITGNGAVSTSR